VPWEPQAFFMELEGKLGLRHFSFAILDFSELPVFMAHVSITAEKEPFDYQVVTILFTKLSFSSLPLL